MLILSAICFFVRFFYSSYESFRSSALPLSNILIFTSRKVIILKLSYSTTPPALFSSVLQAKSRYHFPGLIIPIIIFMKQFQLHSVIKSIGSDLIFILLGLKKQNYRLTYIFPPAYYTSVKTSLLQPLDLYVIRFRQEHLYLTQVFHPLSKRLPSYA